MSLNRYFIYKGSRFRIRVIPLIVLTIVINVLCIPVIFGYFNVSDAICNIFFEHIIPIVMFLVLFPCFFILLFVFHSYIKIKKGRKLVTVFEKNKVTEIISEGQELTNDIKNIESIIYGKNLIYIFYKKGRYYSFFLYSDLDKLEKIFNKYLGNVKKYIES